MQSFKLRGFKVYWPCFAGCKKSSFLHFKCYNLTTYAINFFEIFFIPYVNSPKQDPTIESHKKEFKNQFVQFVLEVIDLECSFLNHSQRILGGKGILECYVTSYLNIIA